MADGDQFEFLRVPAMDMPTIPQNEWLPVKTGWDYVRHATLGLAIKRLGLDGIEGDMAELGVWRGDCARFLHMFDPTRKLYLFDTFEGFPHQDVDKRFRDTSVETVRQTVGPSKNVIIRKGAFPETAKGLEHCRFALASFDLDTYEGILAAWEFFYPRTVPGGYIFVHDYNAMEFNRGPYRATNEFLRDKPECAIEIPDQWGSVLIRKCGSATAPDDRVSFPKRSSSQSSKSPLLRSIRWWQRIGTS
jgi:O-methyltransferase